MECTIAKHIETTPGVCGGKPRIAGTRIRVQDIVILTEANLQTPDEIVAAYPHITLADVHAALAYYFDHVEEINRYIREADELVAWMKANPSSCGPQQAVGTHAGGDSVSP